MPVPAHRRGNTELLRSTPLVPCIICSRRCAMTPSTASRRDISSSHFPQIQCIKKTKAEDVAQPPADQVCMCRLSALLGSAARRLNSIALLECLEAPAMHARRVLCAARCALRADAQIQAQGDRLTAEPVRPAANRQPRCGHHVSMICRRSCLTPATGRLFVTLASRKHTITIFLSEHCTLATLGRWRTRLRVSFDSLALTFLTMSRRYARQAPLSRCEG